MTDRRMMPWSQPGDVEEDGLDQGFTPFPTHCLNFKCQTWEGRTIIRPKLERNARGFMACPKCHNSYGRGPDDSQGRK